MKNILAFLNTISFLDFLKYSLLNMIFFVVASKVFIDFTMLYLIKFGNDMQVGDLVTITFLFHGFYLPIALIFFLLYKSNVST